MPKNAVIENTTETTEAIETTPKRKGKAPNPDSLRQRILAVLRESTEALRPAQITAKLKETYGYEEIKWMNSHLDYFLKHGQVTRPADGLYTIAQN